MSFREKYFKACRESQELRTLTDEELVKMQALLRKMYVELETVCEKHGLTPIAIAGTAHGAMRFGGFKPGDDDIDLIMFRDEYDKLINEYADELPDNIIIFAPNSKHEPISRFAKMVDTNTRLVFPDTVSSESYGVFIDIFPLENLPASTIRRLLYRAKSCIFMYIASSVALYYSTNKGFTKKLMSNSVLGTVIFHMRNLCGFFFSWNPPQKWYDKYDILMTGQPCSGYYNAPSGGPMKRCYIPNNREYYYPVRRVPFDDIWVNVGNKVEQFLENKYGDWKNAPLVGSHHFIKDVIFDCENDTVSRRD